MLLVTCQIHVCAHLHVLLWYMPDTCAAVVHDTVGICTVDGET